MQPFRIMVGPSSWRLDWPPAARHSLVRRASLDLRVLQGREAKSVLLDRPVLLGRPVPLDLPVPKAQGGKPVQQRHR
jgi:hypothetical protein